MGRKKGTGPICAKPGTDRRRAPSEAWSGQRRQEIYTLADSGLEAAEIARRVGSPVGEVELILGLRQKR